MKNSGIILGLLLLPFILRAQPQSVTQVAAQAFVVARMIDKFHVEPRPLDDQFSRDLLHHLEMADGGMVYLWKEDRAKLQAYDTLLDNEIRLKGTGFLNLFAGLYTLRLQQSDSLLKEICVPKKEDRPANEQPFEDTIVPVNLAAVKAKLLRYTRVKGCCSMLRREIGRVLRSPSGATTAIGNLYCKEPGKK